jgi:Zn-dependent protease with chaperone function
VDFFAHQDKARRNTGLLVFYFVITVLMIMTTVYFALMAILALSTANKPHSVDFFSFHPQLFFGVILSVGTVIASGSLYQIWMLSGDGSSVALQLGGTKVQPNTTDLQERILLNVVEEMAIASGTPVPPVYVMGNEQGINAFAAGTTPQNAVIGVTKGSIETLNREELQGVIAHEFSHILNGDMKLNIRLMGLLHGILIIALLGYGLFRIASQMPVRSSSNGDDAKGVVAIIVAMFVFGAIRNRVYRGVFCWVDPGSCITSTGVSSRCVRRSIYPQPNGNSRSSQTNRWMETKINRPSHLRKGSIPSILQPRTGLAVFCNPPTP